jgi:hypothetical protein
MDRLVLSSVRVPAPRVPRLAADAVAAPVGVEAQPEVEVME